MGAFLTRRLLTLGISLILFWPSPTSVGPYPSSLVLPKISYCAATLRSPHTPQFSLLPTSWFLFPTTQATHSSSEAKLR